MTILILKLQAKFLTSISVLSFYLPSLDLLSVIFQLSYNIEFSSFLLKYV